MGSASPAALPLLALVATSASGCINAGPLEDRWHAAREACPDAPWESSEIPPEDCRSVLLGDLGLVDSTFDDLSDEDRRIVEDRMAAALWRLATLPMGTRDDLDQTYLSADLRDELPRYLDVADEDLLEAGFYNFVAHWVVKTVHEEGTGFQYKNGKLWAPEVDDPSVKDVATLVHEARHHAPPGHVRCEDDDDVPQCDRTFDDGAHGWTASVNFLRAGVAPDEPLVRTFEIFAQNSEDHVFDLGGPNWPHPPSALAVPGRWHYVADDSALGKWPEGDDAIAGSACVASVDFDADPATSWRLVRATLTGTQPAPDRVALSGADEVWISHSPDDDDASGWEATDFADRLVPLAGPLRVSLAWPFSVPPATAEDGEVQCQEAWPDSTVVAIALEWYRASPRPGTR